MSKAVRFEDAKRRTKRSKTVMEDFSYVDRLFCVYFVVTRLTMLLSLSEIRSGTKTNEIGTRSLYKIEIN